MKTWQIAGLTILIPASILVVLALIGGIWTMSTYNHAAALKNQYEMKLKDNESEFDNLWKKISQASKIPDQKKEAFREIYVGVANARRSDSQNQLMTWVQENSPNLDLSIYDNLMNLIVSSRNSWTMRQKELVGVAEAYNRTLVTQPSGLLLGLFKFERIEPKIITSTKTQETFSTGLDDLE